MPDIIFLNALKRHLGPIDYVKLLNSLGEAKLKGSFRFWQTQMLSKFSEETKYPVPDSFEAVIKLFEGASFENEHITKEDFLLNPCLWFGNTCVDKHWVKKAWANQEFCDFISYELARSASKVGGFSLVKPTMETLSNILEADDVVALYIYIRDESERIESEWRPEFEKIFPKAVSVLHAVKE